MGYSANEVKGKALTKLMVRGESRQGVVDLNRQLMVLILHKDDLYLWDGPESPV